MLNKLCPNFEVNLFEYTMAKKKIDLRELPTKGSRPYGIKVADSGDLWVACNGSNCLIKVNAENGVVCSSGSRALLAKYIEEE